MTERWAVISDVHGNVRALDAVMDDLRLRSVDAVVNLGDCAYGPFDPRPVLDRLASLGGNTVRGNEDRLLSAAVRGDDSSRTALFCAQWLERAHVDWLAALPALCTIDDVTLFHGTPTDDAESVLTIVEPIGVRARRDDELDEVLSSVRTSLVLCGHDHIPGRAHTRSGTIIVNPGSVGCPAYADDIPYPHVIEAGSPHARYAIVSFEQEDIDVDWVAVAYDWHAAAKDAAANGFPDWAVWLATGRT